MRKDRRPDWAIKLDVEFAKLDAELSKARRAVDRAQSQIKHAEEWLETTRATIMKNIGEVHK